MAKSTAARAAARFKQISCLGLEREVVIPELLKELHALIPSFSNTFHFADERGAVNNIYFENSDLVKLWPLYQQEIFERRELEFKGLAFSDGSRTQFGVHELRNVLSVDQETFQRSDYYNLVARPVGYASNFLRLYFRSGRRVLGGLTIWRSPAAAEWSPEEKRRLASLGTFFVHALTTPASGEASLVADGDSGLIIADTEGKVVYTSARGRQLLFLAASPRSVANSATVRSASLPTPLARLCRSLALIFSDDGLASPPTYRHSNAWGGFNFRAHWLDEARPGFGLIGITVIHEVPLPLRLARAAAKLPLSHRQTEVCVLVATGASTEAIAERLGISKHTANEHCRWIYNKLDVHNRAELVSKLLSA
jgi:DNA-binding CsgD family transcriptional regulator